MKKYLLILLLCSTVLGQTDRAFYNYNTTVDNPQDESRYFQRRLDDIVPATIPVGTGDGQILFWDAVALSWALSTTTNLKWEDSGSVLTVSTINLLNAVAVQYGGTGATTLTDHGILLGSGTGAVTVTAVGATNDVLVGVTGADPVFKTASISAPIPLTTFIPIPTKNTELEWLGGLRLLDEAAAVNSAAPFTATAKGAGRVLFLINAGGDMVGDITITGTSVNRETGAQTGSDTSVITLSGVTTDGSTTGGKAAAITEHKFTKAYITDKWFVGVVQVTTADTAITDMDLYSISFFQFNDQPDITIETFDVTAYTTNAAAELDTYLYFLDVTGDECDLIVLSEQHIGSDAAGDTALVNQPWRLREGNINQAVDGTTDGIWVEAYWLNSPTYLENVTIMILSNRSIPITFQ